MNIYIFGIVIALLYSCSDATQPGGIRNHLGSRTPYRFRSNSNDSRLKFPICKDAKIWMMIRHGTRQPCAKDISNMNITLQDIKYEILLQSKLGKGELTEDQIKPFEQWTSNINTDHARFLTLEGQDEMIHLAERMQKRFPIAIKQKYNNKSFLFRYTDTQRTQQSARNFANGLFDKAESQDVIFSPAAKVDAVLRFYKHCDKWQKQVKKNPITYSEQKLFAVSNEMNRTLERVSKRLGLDYVLTLDNVNLMYKTCGYETAWTKHYLSPWCSAFDLNSAEVLEYYNDLKHYWLDGYGHELTYRQACVSINNMFDTFTNKDSPDATFLFAHSGTVLKILTHLGLYKPKHHLRGDAIIKDRTWKSSIIDCFAANIAFVLYSCEDGDYVLTLHQERIIKLPMCDQELCPLKVLRKKFHDSINNCNFADMCSLTRDEL